jgi:hypothetical protein
MSEWLMWLLTAALAFTFGALVVQYLTVHPVRMSGYLLGSVVAFFALAALLGTHYEGGERALAIALSPALALAGYAVLTHRVLAREDPRPVPELTRSPDDPGLGHTAVVYFTHGEPETYDPIGWINQFREFDEQKIPFVPKLARPFFLYQLRQSYLTVGKSDHRRMHQQMLASLENAFRSQGDMDTRFYLSFLDDDPRPDSAVIQALNGGASRIIVSEVFLTISNHTAEGKELIDEVGCEQYGVEVQYTGPLWDSETLRSMFLQRVNRNLGSADKSKVGLLLVGHGQPDEWDVEWATETEQEQNFRTSVLDLFEADGYRRETLSQAWMEFKEPKPAEKILEFRRNGVKKVFYFSAAISADAIHSQYDVPKLVHRAPIGDEIELVNLGAWNNDPIVIAAIKEKIDSVMAACKQQGGFVRIVDSHLRTAQDAPEAGAAAPIAKPVQKRGGQAGFHHDG